MSDFETHPVGTARRLERLELESGIVWDALANARREVIINRLEIERLKATKKLAARGYADAVADRDRLQSALDKAVDMLIELVQMFDAPFEYRQNTVKRAQVLLDNLAREAEAVEATNG